MGLDNGIIIECPKEDFETTPYFEKDDISKYIGNELAYWRKCYGVRRVIMAVLHGKDGGETLIEAEDVPALIRALKPFLSRDYWDENSDSIWEYEDHFDNTYKVLLRLEWLKDYLKKNPNVKCYFYDSY